MPKYIIERELPGAGDLGDDQIQGISQKSCQVLAEIGAPDSVGGKLCPPMIKSIVFMLPPTRK